MLAMTYRGPRRVRVEHKDDPRIEHPEDVILKVQCATICGSDLHLYGGLVPDTRVGTTFGHEFTGVVEDTGSQVTRFRVGDRVVVPFNISCGRCTLCKKSLFSLCESVNPSAHFVGGVYGYSYTTGGYDGGQAQYVRVPFGNFNPMPIPDDMDDESVLFLSDIFPTGFQAAEMGSIQPGETVAVFGCGPVGVVAQRCAWLLGAGRVIGIDSVDYRLDFARKYAQSEPVDFADGDIVMALRDMTDGRGPDVCIDAVGLEASGSHLHNVLGRRLMLEAGAATSIEWCIEAVRRGGHVVLMGVYGPPYNMIPIGTAMNKGLTLRMAQANCKRYMDMLLEHIRDGRIDSKSLITHRYGLHEIGAAYGMFARKDDHCMKIIINPNN